MPTLISSRQNSHVKDAVRLNQRRYRDERRLTVVEGVREVSRALAQTVSPVEAYLCPPLLAPAGAPVAAQLYALAESGETRLFEVTPEVYARLAYRQDSGGVLLVIPYLPLSLERLPLGQAPLVAVIEGAEKPGNVGAILRTADAVGVDGVVVSSHGQGTDLHNPNVIRASLGTLFAVPVAEADNHSLLAWLRQHRIQIVAAAPAATGAGTRPFTAVDMTGPTAVIGGSEARGLSSLWLAEADWRVHIPMRGVADSLNLAIAMALMLYEADRQRQAATGWTT